MVKWRVWHVKIKPVAVKAYAADGLKRPRITPQHTCWQASKIFSDSFWHSPCFNTSLFTWKSIVLANQKLKRNGFLKQKSSKKLDRRRQKRFLLSTVMILLTKKTAHSEIQKNHIKFTYPQEKACLYRHYKSKSVGWSLGLTKCKGTVESGPLSPGQTERYSQW